MLSCGMDNCKILVACNWNGTLSFPVTELYNEAQILQANFAEKSVPELGEH